MFAKYFTLTFLIALTEGNLLSICLRSYLKIDYVIFYSPKARN